MVRDADAVVRNRILELRAETGRQDLITARKSAAVGSSLALVAAKIRGFFDAASLSLRILFNRSGFAREYMKQINDVARDQYGHIDGALSFPRPASVVARRQDIGFAASETPEDSDPKAKRDRI